MLSVLNLPRHSSNASQLASSVRVIHLNIIVTTILVVWWYIVVFVLVLVPLTDSYWKDSSWIRRHTVSYGLM